MSDDLIEHPTYHEHVRHFFEQQDIDCMVEERGFNLGNYASVKAMASSIFQHVKSGHMPPQPARGWSANRVATLRKWIKDKHPFGTIPMNPDAFATAIGNAAVPLRRNAANLSAAEVDQLKLGFDTLMGREPTTPDSYFALAGIHWFPEPAYCVHHELKYNPWHRVYIDRFDAALGKVPGCEGMTLPYWDITERPPAWLFEPPFDSYTLQADATDDYKLGTQTRHFDASEIVANVSAAAIPEIIAAALNDRTFEGFSAKIEAAHDNGHGACGPSMSATDIAAFDPLFWFFHCNWERLWWVWQVRFDAGMMPGFLATFGDLANADWLDDGFNDLPGFSDVANATIDIARYRYETAPMEMMGDVSDKAKGSIAAARTFSLGSPRKLSLRVKGIDRLKIQGSFRTRIFADGEEVAQRFFFQSTKPEACPNCANRPLVNIDFTIDRARIEGRKLSAQIVRETPAGTIEALDFEQLGSPSINVRELLEGE